MAAVLLAAGCDMPGSAKVFRNNQAPLVVEKGSEFAIALESNPTTGYSWQLTGGLDQGLVELVKKEYEAPATDRLGAAGEEKWTFKAVDLGRAVLRFRYARPWEEKQDEKEEGGAPSAQGSTGTESGHGETAASSGAAAAAEESGEDVAESAEEMEFIVDVVPKGSSSKEPKQYKEEDAEKGVEAGLGTEFAIALESNPTTGYTWRLASYDQDVLYLVSQEYEQAKKEGEGEGKEEGQLVGAGGTELITFRAIKEGETEVELEYLRPWETGVPAEKTVTFKVEVKKEVKEEEKGH
jgi:inhibitor of cysteine peptidase